MAQYRKKPVVIEAIRWMGNNASTDEIKRFCPSVIIHPATGYPIIPTLEGEMLVTVGDYIIKGIKGEFYPCKPDIFESTYDKVEEE